METTLWYRFGKRYYDPEICRWISSDPKKEFFDTYRYTTNPIGFFDPNGWAEHVAMISALAFSKSSPQALNAHILTPMGQFSQQFKNAGSSFTYTMSFTSDELQTQLDENPDMTDLYILSHGDVTGDPALIDDEGKTLKEGDINVKLGDKNITVHVYACTQQGAKWSKKFDTKGSSSKGTSSKTLLANLKTALQKALNTLKANKNKENQKNENKKEKANENIEKEKKLE